MSQGTTPRGQGRRPRPRARAASDGRAPAARQRLGICAIVLSAAAVYANSLSNPFVLDDQASVVQNPTIRGLFPLLGPLVPPPDSPVAGRPLVNLSFALNYTAGGLDPRGYHLFNLAVHILCGLLAYGLIRRTVTLPRARYDAWPQSAASAVALSAVLLWVVHPLNSEVVNYLSQRSESMMAACYLFGMYAAVRALDFTRRGWWQAAASLSCALGALCKESIATAPLAIALYDRTFVFASWREVWHTRRWLYAGLAMTWVVVAAVVASAPRAAVAGFDSGVPVRVYLLNQAPIITEYLRLTIWPDALVAFYGWPQPVTLADVWPQVLFIVMLIGTTLAAYRRQPGIGWLGAWVFLTLAPASSIVPVATEVGADRRMYLPLLALTLLAVVAGRAILGRIASGPAARYAAVGVVAVGAGALGAATVARNREYASAETLARTIVERRPTAVAHHILAESLIVAGRGAEAIPHLREAVALGNSRARLALGLELLRAGRPDEAIDELEAFIATEGRRQVPRWLEPSAADIAGARLGLAAAHASRERWPQVRDEAGRVLDRFPAHAEARGLMADALFAEERWAEAETHYRQYLARNPRDVRRLTNFAVTLVAAERLEEAVAVLRRAVEVEPRDERARYLLAMALFDAGHYQDAAVEVEQAGRLAPGSPAIRALAEQIAAARAGRGPG